MNISPAHWHLLVNHFPIIGTIFGVLFLAAGLLLKKDGMAGTALWMMIIAAIFALAANRTGEGAEEQVEEIAGISHDTIHKHEEAAETGVTIALITGGLALISVFAQWRRIKFARVLMLLTLLAAIGSSGYFGYIGVTGGEIRHSEIRGEIGNNNSQVMPAEEENDD